MNISSVLQEISQEKCAAFVYEKLPQGSSNFRDRIIIYYDGNLRFERYCMGEAAGKVCELTACMPDERGNITWNDAECTYSKKDEAPKMLTGAGRGGLVFDGKISIWQKQNQLKTDPSYGYGFFRMLFSRLFPKK